MRRLYTVFDLVALLVPAAALLAWRQLLKRQWRRFVAAGLIISFGWTVLNAASAARGWREYNEAYTLGLRFLGVPLEEVVFLLITALVFVVALIALQQTIKQRADIQLAQRTLLLVAGAVAFCLVAQLHKERTVVDAMLALATIALLYRSSFIGWRVFWYWNGMVVVWCLISAFLASTIVTYNETYTVGVKIGPVPVEEFLRTWSLLNLLGIMFYTKGLRSAYLALRHRRARSMPATTPNATQPIAYHTSPADTESDTT